MTYIGAPIYRSTKQGRSGSLLPRAELWLRADRGLVTDGAVDFVAADRSWLSAGPGGANDFDLANNDWWLSFWYYSRATSIPTDQVLMRRRQGQTTTNGGWQFAVSASSFFYFYTRAGGVGSTTTIPTAHDQWHFVCVVYDKTTQTLSLRHDNELRTVANAEPATPTDTWFIGASNSISPSLNGCLDSMFMGYASTIALSAAAIQDFLFNGGKGRIGLELATDPVFSSQGGVAHIWDFNENAGQRKDSKGSLHFKEQFLPIVSASGVTYGPNLMPNSTFEVGVSNTVITDAGGSIGILSHETEDPIAGDGSLRLRNEIVGTNGQHPRVRQTATQPIKPATRYRMRLKTKLVSGTAVQGGLLSIGGHPVSAPPLVDGELTTEIQSWDKSFLTRVELANNDIFMPWRGVETFDLLMDDWYVEQEIYGVRNGGFEQIGEGSQPFADWAWSLGGTDAAISRDITESRTGGASCRLHRSSDLNSIARLGAFWHNHK